MPELVWINRRALARPVAIAKAAGADPAELLGAERALEAANARPGYRWTMLIRHGFRAAHREIRAHARHKLYSARVFDELLALAGDDGIYLFEPDELAGELDVPRQQIYSVLVDLEREPIAVLTRIRKGRYLRGIQLTPKVKEYPAPRPRRRGRNGARHAA